MDLGDAQQIRPLLLTTGPGLPPRQRGLEVKLVAAIGQLVLVPEGLTVVTCQDSQTWVPPRPLLQRLHGGVPSWSAETPHKLFHAAREGPLLTPVPEVLPPTPLGPASRREPPCPHS